MARITVEDCLPNVENIFQLVLLAAARARRLANGAEATVPWENDKPTVVALREIAEGNITPEMLREPEPPPADPMMPEGDAHSMFRAPQFGLIRDSDLGERDFGVDDFNKPDVDEVEAPEEGEAAKGKLEAAGDTAEKTEE
jgi:DNA-directed RNA polymerase subunit omega